MEIDHKESAEGKLHKSLTLTPLQYKITWEQIRAFVESECLCRPGYAMPGKIPGQTCSWTFYTRVALYDAAVMSEIARLFLHYVVTHIGHFNFQISGLETAAAPMLTAISLYARLKHNIHINAFICRKTQKEYALKNWIEGAPNDKPVLLIDDIFSSTTSTRRAMDICIDHNLKILPHAFALIHKISSGMGDPREVLAQIDRETASDHMSGVLPLGIKIHTLFTLDDFNLSGANYPIFSTVN